VSMGAAQASGCGVQAMVSPLGGSRNERRPVMPQAFPPQGGSLPRSAVGCLQTAGCATLLRRPMSDEAALLRAIIASPEDDDARLVYSDCLEEHGRADQAE